MKRSAIIVLCAPALFVATGIIIFRWLVWKRRKTLSRKLLF